jgi:hypothetical protein
VTKTHSEKLRSLLAESHRPETVSHLCGYIGFLFEQVVDDLAVHHVAFVVNEVACLDNFFLALRGVIPELLSV